MDPRNNPGCRLHRSLPNLNRIETARLDDVDQERIETARSLLQDVSLLFQPEHSGDAETQVES